MRHNNKFSKPMRMNSGFTMIELLISIAVLAAIVGLAIPSFTALVQRNSITSDTNELVSFLNLARSEAVKRNNTVSVEAKSGDWSNGYELKIDSSSEVLREFTPSNTSTNPTEAASLTKVSFAGSGLLASAASTPSFSLCKTSGKSGRLVSVSPTGRIRSEIIASCP